MILLEKISIEERNKRYSDILEPYKDDPNVFVSFTQDVGKMSHDQVYNTPKTTLIDNLIEKIKQIFLDKKIINSSSVVGRDRYTGEYFDKYSDIIKGYDQSISEQLKDFGEDDLAEKFLNYLKYTNRIDEFESVLQEISELFSNKGIYLGNYYGKFGYDSERKQPSHTVEIDSKKYKIPVVLAKYPEAKDLLNRYTKLYAWVKGHIHGSNAKLGINPKSTYSTPMGIYSYPVKAAWDQYISSNYVPFQGDSPWIWVFKPKHPEKILRGIGDANSYTESNFQEDYNKLKNTLGEDFIYDPYTDGVLYNSSWTADIPGRKFWALTKFIAEKIAKETSGKFNYKWPTIIASCGYEGVVDESGSGTIHVNEPTQAVFWLNNYIEPITLINNDNIRKRTKRNSNYSVSGVIEKIWDKVKESNNKKFKLPDHFIDHMYSSLSNHKDMMQILQEQILIDYPYYYKRFDTNQVLNVILNSPFSIASDYPAITLLDSKYINNPPKKYINLIEEADLYSSIYIHKRWKNYFIDIPQWVVKAWYKNNPEYIVRFYSELSNMYPNIMDTVISSTSTLNLDQLKRVFLSNIDTITKNPNPNIILYNLKLFYSKIEEYPDTFIKILDTIKLSNPEVLQLPKFKQFLNTVNLDLYKFGNISSYISFFEIESNSTVRKRLFKKIKETLTEAYKKYPNDMGEVVVGGVDIYNKVLTFISLSPFSEVLAAFGEDNFVKFITQSKTFNGSSEAKTKILTEVIKHLNKFDTSNISIITNTILQNFQHIPNSRYYNILKAIALKSNFLTSKTINDLLVVIRDLNNYNTIKFDLFVDILLEIKNNSSKPIDFNILIDSKKSIGNQIDTLKILVDNNIIDKDEFNYSDIILRIITDANYYKNITKLNYKLKDENQILNMMDNFKKLKFYDIHYSSYSNYINYILNYIPNDFVLKQLNIIFEILYSINSPYSQRENISISLYKEIIPYLKDMTEEAISGVFYTFNPASTDLSVKKELYKIDKFQYLNALKIKSDQNFQIKIKSSRYEESEILKMIEDKNGSKLKKIFGTPPVIPPGNVIYDKLKTDYFLAEKYLYMVGNPISNEQSEWLNPIILFVLDDILIDNNNYHKSSSIIRTLYDLHQNNLVLNTTTKSKLNSVLQFIIKEKYKDNYIDLEDDGWGILIRTAIACYRFITSKSIHEVLLNINDDKKYYGFTSKQHMVKSIIFTKSPSTELQNKVIELVPKFFSCSSMINFIEDYITKYQQWPNIPLLYDHLNTHCLDMVNLVKKYNNIPAPCKIPVLEEIKELQNKFITEFNLKLQPISTSHYDDTVKGAYIVCKITPVNDIIQPGSVFRIEDSTAYSWGYEYEIVGVSPSEPTIILSRVFDRQDIVTYFDAVVSGNPSKLFSKSDGIEHSYSKFVKELNLILKPLTSQNIDNLKIGNYIFYKTKDAPKYGTVNIITNYSDTSDVFTVKGFYPDDEDLLVTSYYYKDWILQNFDLIVGGNPHKLFEKVKYEIPNGDMGSYDEYEDIKI